MSSKFDTSQWRVPAKQWGGKKWNLNLECYRFIRWMRGSHAWLICYPSIKYHFFKPEKWMLLYLADFICLHITTCLSSENTSTSIPRWLEYIPLGQCGGFSTPQQRGAHKRPRQHKAQTASGLSSLTPHTWWESDIENLWLPLYNISNSKLSRHKIPPEH